MPSDLVLPGVVKLVDTSDLGSDAARYGGSSPSARTVEHGTGIFLFRVHYSNKISSYHGSYYQGKHWLTQRQNLFKN